MSKAYASMNPGYKKITEVLQKLVFAMLALILLLTIWLAVKPAYLLDKIRLGMSDQQVIAILGKPTEFSPCDLGTKPNDCEPPNSRCAEKLRFWKVGIDTWIAVGLDKNQRVCTRHLFDT